MNIKQSELLKVSAWPVEKVVPYARNPRKNDGVPVAKVKASIKEFGFRQPIVVDSEGVIIVGHTRYQAALELGMDSVPVHVAEGLTAAQVKAYRIADNKTGDFAEWDFDLLKLEFSDLQELDFSLDLTGFDDDAIDGIMVDATPEGNTDPDDVPDAHAEPVSKPGDVWVMGSHRLMCGDSTSIDAVDRLMCGKKADMCFTSPPYGLGKSISLSGNSSMSKCDSAYTTHDDNPDEWAELMRGWFSASLSAVSDVWAINVQPLAGNKRQLMRFIADHVDYLVDIVTWDKGHASPPMASGVLASRYEWIVLMSSLINASRAIPLSSWRGTMQSVYSAPPQRDNEFSKIHAATMPIHLPQWVIGDLCDKSKSIYEPFCGTGTTIIAAEMAGRCCYAMELNPAYVDVAVKRWEDFTGKKAVLEDSNAEG